MKPKTGINIESSLIVTFVASLGFVLILGIAPVKMTDQEGFAREEIFLPYLIQDQFSLEPSSEQIRDLPERTSEPGPVPV